MKIIDLEKTKIANKIFETPLPFHGYKTIFGSEWVNGRKTVVRIDIKTRLLYVDFIQKILNSEKASGDIRIISKSKTMRELYDKEKMQVFFEDVFRDKNVESLDEYMEDIFGTNRKILIKDINLNEFTEEFNINNLLYYLLDGCDVRFNLKHKQIKLKDIEKYNLDELKDMSKFNLNLEKRPCDIKDLIKQFEEKSLIII